MSTPRGEQRLRLMVYVQHLLGIGHLVRAARIARAAAEGSFEVTVAIGGDRPPALDFGEAALVELPPVKAGPAGFADLVTPDGHLFGEDDRASRRDQLLALFDRIDPDILLIEAFPFGRRQMRFELVPLLQRAAARAPRPLVVTSVRDILQQNRKPGRDEETIDLIRRWFDLVLVHGDPALARLQDSFPLAATIADKVAYTGIVGPGPLPPAHESFEVIVSVGGGAVGAGLLQAAIEARALSRLRHARWLAVTGPNLPAAQRPPPRDGLTVRVFEPTLPALLRRARASISQAGYNTVADLLQPPACRAILVPFATDGETEQRARAAILERRRLAVVVDPSEADPLRLAEALDHVLDLPPPKTTFHLDGALQTRLLLERAARARR